MKLRDLILKFRAEYNITRKEFAKMCGVSVGTMRNIEHGKCINEKSTVAKIIKVIEPLEHNFEKYMEG